MRAPDSMPPLPAPAGARWLRPTLLGVAVGAMTIVHAVQRDFDVVQQPLSFHVHGAGGWLLSVALAAFGILLALLGGDAAGCPGGPAVRRGFHLAAIGLLAAAAFPSDPWFPWERPPSMAGAVHALAGVVAPAALLVPLGWMSRRRRGLRLAAVIYSIGAVASAVALARGFLADAPPPHLGLAERLLGAAAVVWCALFLHGDGRPAQR